MVSMSEKTLLLPISLSSGDITHGAVYAVCYSTFPHDCIAQSSFTELHKIVGW